MFGLNAIIKNIAPVFIATSPITSYADQIYSIHKTRSSVGFSLDIPLIMLVASILKIFYWFGSHFSTSLLVQAVLTVAVQILLLHVALTNRAAPAHTHQPFQHALAPAPRRRPYGFWQWRPARPYWSFVSYFAAVLLLLHLLLSNTGLFVPYTDLLGAVALAIEATLPLPQLLANWQRRGCKGFRPSVIANWVVGDTFKMWFFFASPSGDVPWAFKACAIFQATCDAGLAIQYLVWADGPEGLSGGGRDKELTSPPPERHAFAMEKMGDAIGAASLGMDMGSAPAYERR